MLVLKRMTSLIHSGATLSNVPNDETRYNSSASSPAALSTHVRLNEYPVMIKIRKVVINMQYLIHKMLEAKT